MGFLIVKQKSSARLGLDQFRSISLIILTLSLLSAWFVEIVRSPVGINASSGVVN